MVPKLAHERARAEARRRRLEAEVGRIAGVLRSLGDVQVAIVFGSLARGEVRFDSDLDLIVVRRDERPFLERVAALQDRLDPDVPLDLLVYTPEEFARLREWRPFVARAVREGEVVFGSLEP